MNRVQPLSVLITVDTEVWCAGWEDIDSKFSAAFDRCIYGKTQRGDYGLPFLLDVLNDHGLNGVFFVEPLFALRFGIGPLEEIVGLIQSHGQSVEMHLHTEWVDEARPVFMPAVTEKRQHMKCFSYEEQCQLLRKAAELLTGAGADRLSAFRAGNFGADNNTLRALQRVGIGKDSSYNPAMPDCAVTTPSVLHQAGMIDGTLEVPMSTFTDGFGKRRQASLTACSFYELRSALLTALEQDWDSFVILTHSFELLNESMGSQNRIVVRRMRELCRFLEHNDTDFETVNFASPGLKPYAGKMQPLRCGVVPSLIRLGEQVLSRIE